MNAPMNLFRLSLSWLRAQPLNSALNLLLLALGMATITLILLLGHQMQERLQRDAQGIDLVVGAKGSPIQIILANVFHLDVPTGNIPLREAMQLARDPLISKAIPLALGDNHRGYRIVGTSHDYPKHYGATLEEGRLWRRPMEAVIGAEVARATGLKVGDHFVGTHGLSDAGGHVHDYQPYHVVGVLDRKRSVIDRLILTSVESVWLVHDDHGHDHKHDHDHDHDHEHDHDHKHDHDHDHDHKHDHSQKHDHDHDHKHDHSQKHDHDHDHDHKHEHSQKHDHDHDHKHEHSQKHDHDHKHDHEAHQDGHGSETHTDEAHADSERQLTAVLIQYRSPLAAAMLPRQINSQGQLQAAVPAVEITRLMQLLGFGLDTLRVFGLLLILSAGLSMFIALYNNLRERQYDLAVIRSLGASRGRLMNLILLEGIILALAGTVLGMMLGHAAAELIGHWLPQARHLEFTGWIWLNAEWGLLLFALLLGLVAAMIPAISAYRTDIARILAKG